ncbi:2OG-Fe(II) oxygenase [Candidatus Pelagibacter sp.]|nr:2OG-Fe(II) oxygenase [Candidatus Pelagibacter sp.]
MKKYKLSSQESPHFIGSWNILNDNLCNQIINFFQNNPQLHKKGVTSGNTINEDVKKTTDITINPNNLKNKDYDLFVTYFNHLNECFLDYKEQFPFLKTFIKKIGIGPFNIQKYSPGDHFLRLHSERTSINTLQRLFAWMTYLNDVKEEDGGSTDFDYYKIKVNPERGKTLIWPAEWTHAHFGSVLKSGEKFIITGWIDFKE